MRLPRLLERLTARSPEPPSLTELAQRHQTDKWGLHHYTPHYDRFLQHLRDDDFTFLELGIGGYLVEGEGGASLRMWRDYFSRATVVGLDIQDKSFVAEDRIVPYQGNQVDPEVIDTIFAAHPDVKVVLDDGSHLNEHVRASFAMIFDRLPIDGIYIIEDTQTSHWPMWGGSLDRDDPTTTMALVKQLVDGLNWEETLDEDYRPTSTDRHVKAVHCFHNVVIIEKGDNTEGSNKREASGWYT